jgi:hypothetical protein
MIAILLGYACAVGESDDTGSAPPPGTAMAFDEVLWGEAFGGKWTSADTEEPCVTAHVEALSSEAELKSLSWLAHRDDVPTIDWKTEPCSSRTSTCVRWQTTTSGADVHGPGVETLQVDLTFHRGQFGTGEVMRPFSIARRPR